MKKTFSQEKKNQRWNAISLTKPKEGTAKVVIFQKVQCGFFEKAVGQPATPKLPNNEKFNLNLTFMKTMNFEQMEQVSGSVNWNSVGCNAAWNAAGLPWAAGIGFVSAGIGGLAFGFVWGVAGSIICG